MFASDALADAVITNRKVFCLIKKQFFLNYLPMLSPKLQSGLNPQVRRVRNSIQIIYEQICMPHPIRVYQSGKFTRKLL